MLQVNENVSLLILFFLNQKNLNPNKYMHGAVVTDKSQHWSLWSIYGQIWMAEAAEALQTLNTNQLKFPSRIKPPTGDKWLEKESKLSRTGLVGAKKREESFKVEKRKKARRSPKIQGYINILQKQQKEELLSSKARKTIHSPLLKVQ